MEEKNGKQVRLWGVVKDKKGNVVTGKRVKLMRKLKRGTRSSYKVIQEGLTSKEGVYSFEVEVDRISKYKVLVIDE